MLLYLLRSYHELGLHQGVKLVLSQRLELHGTLLQRQTLLVGILGHFAGHIVANLGVEACYQHQTIDSNS